MKKIVYVVLVLQLVPGSLIGMGDAGEISRLRRLTSDSLREEWTKIGLLIEEISLLQTVVIKNLECSRERERRAKVPVPSHFAVDIRESEALRRDLEKQRATQQRRLEVYQKMIAERSERAGRERGGLMRLAGAKCGRPLTLAQAIRRWHQSRDDDRR